MIETTIGICAYNEEKNIGSLIQSLLDQKTKDIYIKEIIIVSSACTDRTNEIINNFMEVDKRINLLIQEKREGKASAINLIIKNSKCNIITLISADVLLIEYTIEKLVSPFYDKDIGMTGGHPIPTNNKDSFIGRVVHLLWELNHQLSIENPKFGEIVAFRNIIKEIPMDTAVDESMIEALIRENGLKLYYAQDAIVYNRGPSNIAEMLSQRRRIYAGHIHLKTNSGYIVPSMSITGMVVIIFKMIVNKPVDIPWISGIILIELYARLLGMYDHYIKKKNPYIWDIAETTKKVV